MVNGKGRPSFVPHNIPQSQIETPRKVMLISWLPWLLMAVPSLVGADLSTLQAVEDALRRISPNRIERENNVDFIPASAFNDNFLLNTTTHQDARRPVCHMINMITYLEELGLGPINVATTALALEHLNSGNGAIVKEVEGLNERCPMLFTAEFLDTKNNARVAMGQLNSIFAREEGFRPCAFLGNTFSAVSIATSVQTGIYDSVQVSVTSSSAQLDNKDLHPLFARTGPSSSDMCKPMLDFVYHHLNVRHLAVIASDDPGQSSIVSCLISEQGSYPDMHPVARITLPTNSEARNYEATIAAFKETGFRYVIPLVNPGDHFPLIEEAARQGVAGTGFHTWIFNGGAVGSILTRPFREDSDFVRAMKGSILYAPKSTMPGIGRYDAFAQEIDETWNNELDRQFITTKLPSDFTAQPFARGAYFSTDTVAAMTYDSVILVGLAACNAQKQNFTGGEHYQSMMNTVFEGASGKVILNKKTGSRDVSTTGFSLTNFILSEPASRDGFVNFTAIEFATYVNGEWNRTDDTAKQTGYTIVFNDGTTDIPPDLPPVILTYNFISGPAKIFGFSLAAIILVSAVAFSLWTKIQHKKNNYVVVAAQPLFLQMICAGAFLMGASIIPMGLDRGILGDHATCMTTPWLLSLGWCIVFSSLFSKTLRVNKVFHNPNFRRVIVTTQDVIRPMVAIMALNVILLLAWTLISPLKWTQSSDFVLDTFGRLKEISYECDSDHHNYFIVPLIVINAAALLVANYQAYVARKIATEFAESEYIGSAMGLISVAFSIIVPVMIIAEEGDISVRFFVNAGFIFSVSMSVLVFIFVPKMMQGFKPISGRAKVRNAIRQSVNIRTQSSFEEAAPIVGSVVVNHPKIGSQELVGLKAKIGALEETNRVLMERLKNESV